MIVHLPEELARHLQSEVRNGVFASPDEAICEALRLLRSRKEQPPAQSKPLSADELNRRLLETGLLSRIPTTLDPAAYQEFTPIIAQGEPVSETIIRERR